MKFRNTLFGLASLALLSTIGLNSAIAAVHQQRSSGKSNHYAQQTNRHHLNVQRSKLYNARHSAQRRHSTNKGRYHASRQQIRHGKPSHRHPVVKRHHRYRHHKRWHRFHHDHGRYVRHHRGYWSAYHRGYKRGYRHRVRNGHHYYYNDAGFYFAGYGHIEHGHYHNRHCPHWHFEDFAAAAILTAILLDR